MAENILFNHLLNGEEDSCNNYLDEALQGGNNLVKFLSGMLYTAASIRGLKNEDFHPIICLLYTSPSPRDGLLSRMPSSA